MNKKHKIIIAIVLILILIIAGYLWYKKAEEERMGPVSFDSFKKTEVDGKVFMENEEIGLKFMVPEGWEVQDLPWGSVSVTSQDFEPFKEQSPVPQKGCLININPKIQIEGSEYDLQYTDFKQMIDNEKYLSYENTENRNCKLEEFSGIKGIQCNLYTDENKENKGNFIYINIPYNNVIYHFETHVFGENKENCLTSFGDFLSTISIKKK